MTVRQTFDGNWTIGQVEFTANGNSDPVSIPSAHPTVQAAGTFGAGTVAVEGSNDGVNWGTVNDLAGAAVALSDDNPNGLLERCRFYRAVLSGATGPDLTVTFAGAKTA